jgi:Na+/H+ antiporter NhaA
MKTSNKLKVVTGLALICVLYGSVTGLFAQGSAQAPNNLFYERLEPYQNSSLLLGAGVGIAVFAVAYMVYELIQRLNKHRYYVLFMISIISGITIGFVASFLVHNMAGDFGLITNSTAAAIFDAGVAAFFGGVFGFATALVVNEHL